VRIFLSEFLCGGGWPDDVLPASLATEGRSMLLAVAEDLARDGAAEVLTTWDARLDPPDWPTGVRATVVPDARDEFQVARGLSAEADATWIIAPECGGLLRDRVAKIAPASGMRLNCSPEAIEFCSDKLRLATWLLERDIPTPLTWAWDSAVDPTDESLRIGGEHIAWPVVVKPRDGAGSQSTFLVAGPTPGARPGVSWDELQRGLTDVPWPGGWIVQPFVGGRALSVAAIVRTPSDFDILPIGEQSLSGDGRLTYRGGGIPTENVPETAIRRLVETVVGALPGLFGWIGFDLVLPEEEGGFPVLIEINPRLTTSYIGYRRLTGGNLALRIVDPNADRPPVEFFGAVQFSADGNCHRTGSSGV